MRICVSGTGSQGKSTFISDFLKEWETYTTPKSTYRDFIKNKHSKKTNKDIQWRILNNMLDEVTSHGKKDGSNIIYDRGPLDNITYSLWCFDKNIGKIDQKFIDKCVPLVRESFKFIDIIFFAPLTKVSSIEYDTNSFNKDKKRGLTDENYRVEIDNIFKALKYDWDVNDESKFFDSKDKPGLIEVFGSPAERIQIAKLYLDKKGELIGGENALGDIVNEEDIRQQEALKAQFGISDTQSKIFGNDPGELHGYQ